MTALEVLVVPTREPGRYRARARGTGRDGEQHAVTVEAGDREEALKAAARAWYQLHEERNDR